ncbi:hypothetical protein JKF63_06458 [Porcisia hertigi]|uniref:Vacuolar membrane-associated protein Iml1 N-terminal domain-containing protein n=1 Tax=Porcisia hertigi TaxID=2761500 RepID=A0A836LJZ3_9TRYP|nr:hypothetical protein JKF63_06458 [Porcisia hertigi]
MKGACLRRQQRHSNQPNVPQGSDAPVSLVFRTHGDSLSKAAFLFCPKNFNLANPVAAARPPAPAAPLISSSTSSPSAGALLPPSGHLLSATSQQLSSQHEGRRATAATSSSAATESVETLVEAIVELRPFFQPLHHSQAGGGVGSHHNLSGLAPVSPLVSSTADGTAPAHRGLPPRTQSVSSVRHNSHVDLMGLSSIHFTTPGGGFGSLGGGGDSGSVTLAQSVAASRGSEWSQSSATLARSGASTAAAAILGGSAQGGPVGINTSMLGNATYTNASPMSGVPGPAAGPGSGGAGGGGGAGGASVGGVGTAGGSCFLMHPSGGWICRAMAFNEKEVSHANGAISVSQSLTSKCALINEVAKGKVMARILSSYQDVQRRYGLSHVELTVVNQYLSRSDMFLISEALRERILYEGEETHVCGFRIRVREMLQSVVSSPNKTSSGAATSIVSSALSAPNACVNASSAAAAPPGGVSSSGATSTAVPGCGTSGSAANIGAGAACVTGAAAAAAASVIGANANVRVGCGIVVPTTRINFQSLSPVYYILLELSSEMWETTIDGRIALTLAIRKFLSELLLKQLPKRKASPLICVVFTGRLHREFQFDRHRDVFHMLELPRELRNNVDIVEEIRMHCEALVQRVLRGVQDSARRRLEAECVAYREAATALHPVSGEAKGVRGRPVNDSDDLYTEHYSSQERGMNDMSPSTGSTSQFPTTPETRKWARPNTVFSSSAAAAAAATATTATETTFDAYVQSRQRHIDEITVQQLFVHAKQSNILEALGIVLERCTHNYIDRNLTLCGHAVTVVSAGKGLYQVTNNLVQVVCARLHDIGLEKVHVVCIGRPPLHVTPLLEYTSIDDTLRSQYHLHSHAPAGAGLGARGAPGRVPASPVSPGEVEHYYETPEWMSVFFFNASLQHKSGGETVFELLPKECWQRQHSVLAALKTLWPTLPQPQPHAQTRPSQPSQLYSVSTLLSGGAAGDGGEEDGSASAAGDVAGGIVGRAAVTVAAAAATLDSSGNHGIGAEEASLTCCHAPLLIPGLGLRPYPVPEVTLPVHPHSPDTLLYVYGLGGGTAESHHMGRSAGVAAGFTVAAAGTGCVSSQPLVPLYPQPCAADLSSVSWTGSISAEHAFSPSSPLVDASRRVASTGWLGARAPMPTAFTCSSPLWARTAKTGNKIFASSAPPTQESIPHGVAGVGTMTLQGGTGWQQTQLQQGLKAALPSHTGPPSTLYSPLLQPARYVQPSYTFNSTPFTSGGAPSNGIWGSEATPTSVAAAAAAAGSPLHLRRLRSGAVTASGLGYNHVAVPAENACPRAAVMLVAAAAFGSGHPRHPNSLPSYYATGCKPALHISRSFDHKTMANPEQHSLGAFEHSGHSVGSSLLGCDNSAPRQQTRSVLWRGGSPKSSTNSIVTTMAAATTAAGRDLGVSRSNGVHRIGGGLRPVQLRLDDGHVYRDVMALAVPCASCAWYCLHASKPHQDSVGGAAAVSLGGSTAATSASAPVNLAARQGGSGGAATAISVSGGSSPFTAAATMRRRHLQCRDGRSRALEDDATGAPGGSCHNNASVQLPAKRWHRALSSTRSDAVFCGCNVVDSDLRSGYLVLEVTINAAVLPRSFWSPQLVLNDNYWAYLMSCFTGRDDRLTLDEELEFTSEADTNNEDTLTISDSSTDGLLPPQHASGSLGGQKVNRGGTAASSAALATAVGGSKESGGGTRGGREGGGGAGDVYRFQSVFRATEVFCRSHSGITPDGRTLIIPTHSNSLHFQSPEEILLRITQQLFVSTPDEGGEVAPDQRGPTTPASPRGDGTIAVGDEAIEKRAKDVCMALQFPHGKGGGGGEAHSSAAVAAASARQQSCFENSREGKEEAERGCLVSRTSCGVAAKPTPPVAGSVDGETPTPELPHLPGERAMWCDRESTSGNSASRRAQSFAATAKGTTAAVSPPPRTPLSSSSSSPPRCTAHASSSVHVSPEAALPVTLNATAPAGTSSPAQNSTSGSGTSVTPAAQSRPLRLPTIVTVTGSPTSAAGAPPLPSPRALAMPVTSASGPGGTSIDDPLSSFPTPTTATHLAGQPSGLGPFYLDDVPLMPGTTVTVGFVQLRDSLLFAIKPINPLRQGSEEEQREDMTGFSQPAESVSTATVLRRRWQWKHPDVASEPPHLASWTRLCTCRLLPLYGSKPAYPRESFYSVSPHQYTVTTPGGSPADPLEERRRLLEFVLQRLQQQYQLVVDSPGLAAGAQWPRADLSPNARLEMSLGHQTHTLKLDETVKTISVTRMLHRGMYSNGQVTHMLSYRYLLWNYLADEFSVREMHMEAQVGERNAFHWEALDRWLQERPNAFIPRGPDVWLRSREVAVVLLPEDPTHPPSYEEFCRFIGYRFSVHLSTHGKVAWRPHEDPVSFDFSETTPLTFPAPPQLMEVVLVHDNPVALDTRNVIDRVTGRTVAFDVSVQERFMSIDITLPQQYDACCCYFLRVSWLACAASIVMDWLGSFIANASRFHFHAVPVGCYYHSPKTESLTSHYDVEAASPEEEPALRRALVELLVMPAYRYYPDTPVLTRNCRLVHGSGLCYVILPPNARTVAQWYQNALVRQGSVEQVELLALFKEAVATARQRAAYIVSGNVITENVSSSTSGPP